MSMFQAVIQITLITIYTYQLSSFTFNLGTSRIFLLVYSTITIQMSRNGFVWRWSRLTRYWFIAHWTNWYLDIFQSWRRTSMSFISPVLSTKALFTSITFNGQKIQLPACFLTALISDMWKFHLVQAMLDYWSHYWFQILFYNPWFCFVIIREYSS